MRRIITVLLLVLATSFAMGQDFIDQVFKQYVGKQGFTSVVISPQVFTLLSAIDPNDKDLKTISEKISSLKILVSEDKAIGFTNEIRSKMKSTNFVSIMEVIDGKQKVNFYVKQSGETITDFVLIAIDDKEEVLLSITGNFKLNELANLGGKNAIGGKDGHLSLLKKLEDK